MNDVFSTVLGFMLAITVWVFLVIGVAWLIATVLDKAKEFKDMAYSRKMNKHFKEQLDEEP